jgi:hypothetical protein
MSTESDQAHLHENDDEVRVMDLKLNGLPPRSICDPIVYYNRVQNLCRTKDAIDVREIDFFMRVRRTTDRDFRTVIDEKNFCQGKHQYAVLTNNDWIR